MLPIRPLLAVALLVSVLPSPAAEVMAPMGAPVCNHVRFVPAPSREQNVVGARIMGSNVSQTGGYQVLAEIKDKPREGEWTDLVFPNNKLYRWLRYEAPPGSHGSIAELEFYSGAKKLDGYKFASVGELNGRGWQYAFDGDPRTWVEMDAPDGQFAGVDLWEQATARTPKFLPPPAREDKPLEVALNELTPYATVRYTLDGTTPTATTGEIFKKPFKLETTTTVVAAAFVEGWAPSPLLIGTYLIAPGAKPGLSSLHIGNTLTNITEQFPMFVRTTGRDHSYRIFTVPSARTEQLWAEHDAGRKREWVMDWEYFKHIDHLTLQPRDFRIPEEVKWDQEFITLVRSKSADVQPWLYTEWVERDRLRPTDKGQVPSTQMTKVFPALTWEESMGAMLLYVEDLRTALVKADTKGGKGSKPARVLPSNLALGWIHNQIEHGNFPGAKPGDFYSLLFRDSLHPNPAGAYLVDLTWYAAFYGESPEGKMLPVGLNVTPEQATAMQRLAWEVIQNYPDCGIFEEGKTPVEPPEFSPTARTIPDVTEVTLSSKTPGAWFRYTLDGTTPTRTTGYVYCGVISARPGMMVKAIAFKSGMADSSVADASYQVDLPGKPGKLPK